MILLNAFKDPSKSQVFFEYDLKIQAHLKKKKKLS